MHGIKEKEEDKQWDAMERGRISEPDVAAVSLSELWRSLDPQDNAGLWISYTISLTLKSASARL